MIEELRKIRNRQPFVPYDILLTDGRRLRITDQFHVAFARTFVTVYDESSDRFIDVANSSVDQVTVDGAAIGKAF